MKCYVCGADTGSIKRYCDRCRPFFTNRSDRMKRRAALIAAYDPAVDGFRDHYTVMCSKIDGLVKYWE